MFHLRNGADDPYFERKDDGNNDKIFTPQSLEPPVRGIHMIGHDPHLVLATVSIIFQEPIDSMRMFVA